MTVHLQNKTTLAKRDYPNGLSEAYSLHSTAADELTRLQTKHVLGAESSFQACKGRCTNPRDSHEGTVRPFPTAAPSKLPGLAPSLLLARSPPLPPSLPPAAVAAPPRTFLEDFAPLFAYLDPFIPLLHIYLPYTEKWVSVQRRQPPQTPAMDSARHATRLSCRLHRPLHPGFRFPHSVSLFRNPTPSVP